jgi:protein phosphatase
METKLSTSLIEVSAMTDKGLLRRKNEDAFAVCTDLSKPLWESPARPVSLSEKGGLLVIADGLGGARAGDLASKIAVESVSEFFSSIAIPPLPTDEILKKILADSIGVAHGKILSCAEKDTSCFGMGTTIVMAWILKEKIVTGWVGDSRCYLINEDEIKILTRDHSPVWPLVESGELTPDQADMHPQSNIMTQCLGDPFQNPIPDFVSRPVQAGDIFLLCSDGLNAMLRMHEIQHIILQKKPLNLINQDLIVSANAKGGHDNITNIIVRYLSIE